MSQRKAALLARERNRQELEINPGSEHDFADEEKDKDFKDSTKGNFKNKFKI